MQPPLRILMVVNLPWDNRLGAPRVWMELAAAWSAAGHRISKFSYEDAFPGQPTSGAAFTLRQSMFPAKAAAFIRAHSDEFDVIDSLVGTITASKASMNFRGLLVARSVGLFSLYDQFTKMARRRWGAPPKGTLGGHLFHRLIARRLTRQSETALQACDLLNLPNEDELAAIRNDHAISKAAIVQPYGLTAERQEALRGIVLPHSARVSFIGMWSSRKGSKDWAAIIREIRTLVPGATFRFLGTMVPDSVVLKDLPIDAKDYVECVSKYEVNELPALLRDCKVGAFPSYVEGFGFAVLEQLAAGIPTVAYDVPGPRQMLADGLRQLAVPAGDIVALARKIADLLQTEGAIYGGLRAACRAVAAQFAWNEIAEATIDAYRIQYGQLTELA